MIVISDDVRMLSVEVLDISVKSFIRDWVRSKMVCLQVNAIVKPNVKRTNILNCLLNSFFYDLY